MYIYNITFNIEESIHEEWLQWMKEEYIPEMLKTEKFTQALMSRVLVEEAMGGITYSVQYQTKDRETLNLYYQEDAERLQKKLLRFKDKIVYFNSEMKIIHKR